VVAIDSASKMKGKRVVTTIEKGIEIMEAKKIHRTLDVFVVYTSSTYFVICVDKIIFMVCDYGQLQ
jgi:hypothetical protein